MTLAQVAFGWIESEKEFHLLHLNQILLAQKNSEMTKIRSHAAHMWSKESVNAMQSNM